MGLLSRKTRTTPPAPAKVNGEFEVHLVALSCTEPPPEYSRWTARLLADTSVELGHIDAILHLTVSRVLKNELKPHLSKYWCIPPHQNAAFVACMEDVPEVYRLTFNEPVPVICMDEKPLQLLGEKRRGCPCSPGKTSRMDIEYIRKGVCSIFLFCEPLGG